jgi:lipopolysaccharide/colanic/teichoic acid biosynthesis glycosyltransferase
MKSDSNSIKSPALEASPKPIANWFTAQKPGLTGWAQVNGGRAETDTAEKIESCVECDLYYIENLSLTFDFYTLARARLALITTQNAC